MLLEKQLLLTGVLAGGRLFLEDLRHFLVLGHGLFGHLDASLDLRLGSGGRAGPYVLKFGLRSANDDASVSRRAADTLGSRSAPSVLAEHGRGAGG